MEKTDFLKSISEYQPGQGINGHIDRVESFGPVVASLSLGSPVVMSFSLGNNSVDVLLERRSMVFLTGDARFKWKHAYVLAVAPLSIGTCARFSNPPNRQQYFS